MNQAEKDASRDCKGCRSDYRVTDEQIRKMLSHPMFQSGSGHCVPDSVYAERLRHCFDCVQLIGGHTCKLCGCIVQVTAKLKEKSCPAPGGIGWQKYG